MRRNVSQKVLVVLLLLVALGVRLVGLGWGLPFVYHPDEPTHVNIVLNILKTGDFNPHWFKYPSFRIYVSLPVAVLYFLLAVSRGHFASVQDLVAANMLTVGSGTTDIPGLYYGLRLLMALFGVAGVLYLYLWARKHWNTRTGFVAAAFLALSSVHVLVSHWYRPDTVLALFSAAAVLASVQLYRDDDLRAYVVCGLLAGLAASVKYNVAGLQLIPVFLAHFFAKRQVFDWRLWITPLVSLLMFLVVTPYAILDLPGFLDGFAYEIRHYFVRGHPGADSAVAFGDNLLWYLSKLLHYDGAIAVLALCAPLLVERRRRPETLLLLSWPLLILALNASPRARTVLAIVPMLLVLYLLAAISVDRLVAIAKSRIASLRTERLVLWILVTLLLIVPVARTWRTDSCFVRPDVRTTARTWVEEHLSPGTRIALEVYGPVLQREGVRYHRLLIDRSPEWYQAAGVEYLVASHYWAYFTSPELYPAEVAAYEGLFEFPLAAGIEGPLQYMWDPIREIRIHRVVIPKRYEFLMSEHDAPWLEGGFFDPESINGESLRWTGGRAVAQVRLKAGVEYVVRVRGEAMRPDGVDPARTAAYAEERLLGEHTWSNAREEWAFRVRIGEQEDGDEQHTRIILDSNTWQPSQAVGSQDERRLGVLLQAIVIEEAPPGDGLGVQ